MVLLLNLKLKLYQLMSLGVVCSSYHYTTTTFYKFSKNNEFIGRSASEMDITSATLTFTRRSFLKHFVGISCGFLFTSPSSSSASSSSSTTTTTTTTTVEQDIKILKECLVTLTNLVDNWERATVDCNYADVPRELLEQKNKELLLEKASTWALFDKSASVVVSCKRTNRLVRDYIGVTGKGPCVGADRRMMKKQLIDSLNPDLLEEYYSAVEKYSQSMSSAISLTYMAGTADFDSVNNFEKGKQDSALGRGDTSLEKARRSIIEANHSLKVVVELLSEGQE